MKRLFLSFAALISLATPVAAQTQQPVALEGTVKLEQQVVENGETKVRLVEPSMVVPGNRLLFSTKYRNTGAETVRNFVLTNPLPSAVAISSEDAAVLTVSVDGGQSWGRLTSLTVAGADGARRPATASDVTHVRWVVPAIAPGASGEVTFHATVR